MCAYTMNGHKSTVWQLDFNTEATHLVSCSEDRSLIVWKVSENSYERVTTLEEAHLRAIYSVSWAGKDTIATAGADN
jgi:cytosolic iron-sulfur protein assembly protein CIAO1